LKQLEAKKFEDNHLKELERRRFQQAKQRLRDFVIAYNPQEEQDDFSILEQERLLNYFKHRYSTFVQLMKEALTARRVKGPA
jgi:hypothetical protein